ncbi:MAG: tRNA1(Val) (adenine(37)-N6)-methyltransferase [Pseudobutyrivibrio sp.]|nr:tRNA1(Val) (adenine(37)-N6)-methyltransferase [Pseudobutyrivibrio sp.]
MDNLVRSDERVDDLQINGYKIIQHPDKFCFGMDAVLLSSFAKVKEGEVAIDLGTGTGILPILLEAKTEGEHFTGLEIQSESAEMANRSVILNNLQDKIDIIEGDIKEASKIFGKASMNVVTSNPPYMTNHHGLKNPNDAKAIARHELLCSLEDVVRETSALLKQMGRCYFVHRPFRLVEIITLMRQYKLEPKRMRLVYPFVDKEPNMVLIEGVKGGGPQLTVEKPLIVYDAPGAYTKEIYEIYGMIMQ